MRRPEVHVARDAAVRFIAAVEALERRDDHETTKDSRISPFWGSRESGAVRRASMDLTRALAEMRKP